MAVVTSMPRVLLLAGVGLLVGLAHPLPAQDTPVLHGPHDMLPLLGVDQSHWDRILDHRPIHADENEVLLRLLYVIDRFPQREVYRWAYPVTSFQQLFEKAEESRGEFFNLEGRVTRVMVRQPVPELVNRFEFDRYYECRWVNPAGEEGVVFTRSVPKAWLDRPSPLDERASARGLFVKVIGDRPEEAQPVFVAERIAWHPDTLLGRLGMDIGLLDTLVDNQRLTAQESECFYQMLAAVGRARPGQLRQAAQAALALAKASSGAAAGEAASGVEAAPQALVATDTSDPLATGYSVVPLFNDPASVRGELVELAGTTRSVLRVELSAEDPLGIRARFGIDHYYQVSLFTPDSQGNPITICVRNVPEGMPIGEGPRFAEQIRVAGFFLKKWAYRIALPEEVPASSGDDDGEPLRRQLAPMVVARDLVWYPAQPPRRDARSAAVAAGVLIVVLTVFLVVAWRRKGHTRSPARKFAGESSPSEGLPDKLPDFDAPGPDDRPSS